MLLFVSDAVRTICKDACLLFLINNYTTFLMQCNVTLRGGERGQRNSKWSVDTMELARILIRKVMTLSPLLSLFLSRLYLG